MWAVIKRLTPSWKWSDAFWNARMIYCFLEYSPSSLAERIRQFFSKSNLDSRYHLVIMSASFSGQYYLFCNYVHPFQSTGRSSPAIRKYLAARQNGETVSFSQLLRDLNHWPFRLSDLNYLNVLRHSLTEVFYFSYIAIDGDPNPIVMPKSEPEYGCPSLVFV